MQPVSFDLSLPLPAVTAEALHAVDLPYRLTSGALDTPENAAMWLDASGAVRAWAVFQPVFWTIDTGGDPAMLPEILRWAERRAPELGRPCWFVEAWETDAEKLAALEAAGYMPQTAVPANPWFKLRMERSVPPLDATPPAGVSIRSLRGPEEMEAYVALHRHAFQSEAMTARWRAATLNHPAYRPELDLVAEADDGRLAGFCIGWLAEETGHLEPMGVHADFRRRGIGAALIAELLRRMARLGAVRCLVEPECGPSPAVALYEAAGFRTTGRIHLCRKDFPG